MKKKTKPTQQKNPKTPYIHSIPYDNLKKIFIANFKFPLFHDISIAVVHI